MLDLMMRTSFICLPALRLHALYILLPFPIFLLSSYILRIITPGSREKGDRKRWRRVGIDGIVDSTDSTLQHDDPTRFHKGVPKTEIEHGLEVEDRKFVRSHE
ncbi:hypothetical protein TanjilG_31662 [Lupinus angustifolius]|uniref:Uncharacterized protein n=1 Tax=Lupinus angustifolius TaxID=3871 RepID=A0A4P1RMC7_LUPAN|nr:hypothetical protein TanjilG_31662 [Lupinus angustifolius]